MMMDPRTEMRSACRGPDHVLVTCCQGGVRVAHAALGLRLAGYPNVRIHTGSRADWDTDPSLPIDPPMVEAAS